MNIKNKVLYLLKDMVSRRYFFLWLKLVIKNTNWVEEQIPFFPFRLTDWLDRHLKSDMRVFEYGSGGSTLFFAKRVNLIISIEHDKDWYQFLDKILKKNAIKNCEYLLFQPENTGLKNKLDDSYQNSAKKEDSTDPYFTLVKQCSQTQNPSSENLVKYIHSIDKYPDGYFDLISIDGRARNLCVARAIRKVHKGGLLLMDDTNRKIYLPSLNLLKQYPKQEFFGLGAGFNQITTVWKIS